MEFYGKDDVKFVKWSANGNLIIAMKNDVNFLIERESPVFHDSLNMVRRIAVAEKQNGSYRSGSTTFLFANAPTPKKFSDSQKDVLCSMIRGMYDARFHGVKYNSTNVYNVHTNTVTSLRLAGLVELKGYSHAKLTLKGFLVARKLFGKTYKQFVQETEEHLERVSSENNMKDRVATYIMNSLENAGITRWTIVEKKRDGIILCAKGGYNSLNITVKLGVGITAFTDKYVSKETHTNCSEIFIEAAQISKIVAAL